MATYSYQLNKRNSNQRTKCNLFKTAEEERRIVFRGEEPKQEHFAYTLLGIHQIIDVEDTINITTNKYLSIMEEPTASFPHPTNNLVTPLLTDLYQITMAYAYWKTNQHHKSAHFELFFRKNPFGGSYTIFAGLDEVLKFLSNF